MLGLFEVLPAERPLGDMSHNGSPSTDIRAVTEKAKTRLLENSPAPKSKGGRPKGARDKLPRKGSQRPPDTAGTSQPLSSGPILTDNAALAFARTVKVTISLPFDVVATRTGCEGVRLSQDEREALGEQGAACMEAVAPFLNGKWGAISMFALSLAMVSASKMMILEKHERERAENAKPVNDPTVRGH